MLRVGLPLIVAALIVTMAGLLATQTTAQIPPHAPGTICLTPDFWCWAPEQGIPGEPCQCQVRDGEPVEGVLG